MSLYEELFYPTRFKITVMVVLVVYVVLSSIYLVSFNTRDNVPPFEEPQLHLLEKTFVLIAFPAAYLLLPMSYIGSITDFGMGVIPIELFVIYALACLVASLKYRWDRIPRGVRPPRI